MGSILSVLCTRRVIRYRAAQALVIHPGPIEAAGASFPFGEPVAGIPDAAGASLGLLGGDDPVNIVSARNGRDVRPHGSRLGVCGRESLPQIGRHSGFRLLCDRRDFQRDDVPAASRILRSTLSQWPPWPSGSSVARKAEPLIVPSTLARPRAGSFALASLGRVRKVQETAFAGPAGRNSVALKRILEALLESPSAEFLDVILAIVLTPGHSLLPGSAGIGKSLSTHACHNGFSRTATPAA
jgi:hypothetical protein